MANSESETEMIPQSSELRTLDAATAEQIFPSMKRVLAISKPTYFHPAWEKRLANNQINQVNFYELSFLRQVLISPSFVEQARFNPRDGDYMVELLLRFFHSHAPNAKLDLLYDGGDQISESHRQQLSHSWAAGGENFHPWPSTLWASIQENSYDAVFLLYPDPIGYGWEQLEKQVLKMGLANVFVLNGRKRLFYLDERGRKALRRRRFLARYWVVELLLAASLILLSIPLGLYDLARAKR